MEEYIETLSKFEKPKRKVKRMDDSSAAECYYDPYSSLSFQERILQDEETILTYMTWIDNNKHLIKDKIVMDVGCGTGILSMFAATAGAARVYSVEWSSIAEQADEIVKENSLQHKIFVLKGRVDQVSLPKGKDKVDVIISLWMGYSLLQGDRLKAVIQARDRWLKPDGVIIPDQATMYLSCISDHKHREKKIESWKNVYGYDMSVAVDDIIKFPVYKAFSPHQVVTNKCKIKQINLLKAKYKDCIRNVKFGVRAVRDDFIQGFMLHFTVNFSRDENKTEINTDPLLSPTHWGQTVYYLKDYIPIKRKETVIGTVHFFSVNDDIRLLGVIIGYYTRGVVSGMIKEMNNYVLRV